MVLGSAHLANPEHFPGIFMHKVGNGELLPEEKKGIFYSHQDYLLPPPTYPACRQGLWDGIWVIKGTQEGPSVF